MGLLARRTVDLAEYFKPSKSFILVQDFNSNDILAFLFDHLCVEIHRGGRLPEISACQIGCCLVVGHLLRGTALLLFSLNAQSRDSFLEAR